MMRDHISGLFSKENKHPFTRASARPILVLAMWDQEILSQYPRVQSLIAQDHHEGGDIEVPMNRVLHIIFSKWFLITTNFRPLTSRSSSLDITQKIIGDIFELLRGLFCGSGERGQKKIVDVWVKTHPFPFSPHLPNQRSSSNETKWFGMPKISFLSRMDWLVEKNQFCGLL